MRLSTIISAALAMTVSSVTAAAVVPAPRSNVAEAAAPAAAAGALNGRDAKIRCEPGEKMCSDKLDSTGFPERGIVLICNEFGTDWDIVDVCGRYADGAVCGYEGSIWNPVCQN